MFDNNELNLEILAEECAELIQAKSKMVRFGAQSINPETGELNIDYFNQEVADVLALFEILMENGVIFDRDRLRTLINKKRDKMRRFYNV